VASFWWRVKLGTAAVPAAGGFLPNAQTGLNIELKANCTESTIFLMRVHAFRHFTLLCSHSRIAKFSITEERAHAVSLNSSGAEFAVPHKLSPNMAQFIPVSDFYLVFGGMQRPPCAAFPNVSPFVTANHDSRIIAVARSGIES
jgi:hypothetical protein